MLCVSREIGEHACAARQPALCARFGSVAGEDEHRPRARGGGRLQVALRIAHHVDGVQGYVEAPSHLDEHSRPRLAALTAGIGRMRAEEERVDAAADLCQGADERVVDGEQRVRVEQAARDARLVSHYHHAVVGLRQPRNRLQATLDRPEFLRRLDVLVAVVVDGAVAIEDDELHTASLEMSATRFIALRKSASSASRFSRSAFCSAITITLSKKASTGAFSTAKVLR